MKSGLGIYEASVVVTSDTCFMEPKKDLSGDYVANSLKSMGFKQVNKHIVPDEKDLITKTVKAASDQPDNILTITVGGTGLCPRDVTPEATSILYDKDCPGISTALIFEGLCHSPHAALSRLTAGIYGQCLIVNFPGKTKACVECFGSLSRVIDHALEQITGNLAAVNTTHKKQDQSCSSFPFKLDVSLGERTLNSGANKVLEKPEEDLSTPVTPPPRSKKLSNLINNNDSESLNLSNLMTAKFSQLDLKPLKPASQYPLIDYEKALDIMGSLAYTVCQTQQSIKLDSNESANSILGDILAEKAQSQISIPPFPVSTMDGYVLNIPKTLKGVMTELGIIEAVLVSGLEEFEKLQLDSEQGFSFFCYQVNTGGRVPEKNFAVIPVEKTAKIAKDTITIAKIETNRYVRNPGSDICEADFLEAGTVIGPAELSIILSMGCREVSVVKKPTIGFLSTGDELVDFYQYDRKNKVKVIDANRPLLIALFKKKGFSVVDIGMAMDNPKDILLKIHTGLKESDILIVTGGASMGSKDHVKDVVEQIGGIIHFGRVNIKPGKPAAMASLMVGGKRRFIFCLPGNPVSAYVTSLVLVLPFIEHGIRNHLGSDVPLTMDAIGDLIYVKIADITDADYEHVFDGRLEFARARLSREPNESHLANVSTRQQSSRLWSIKDCDCLILIDPSMKGSKFRVGQIYRALRLRN